MTDVQHLSLIIYIMYLQVGPLSYSNHIKLLKCSHTRDMLPNNQHMYFVRSLIGIN
jgi:hypothetical protein